MPKEIPDCPQKPKRVSGVTSRSYEIKLVTPMVGGGAIAGAVDTDFPIRPTAIRGHLRYWWRLVHGQSLGECMWQREEEIFGSTKFPSSIEISVSKCSNISMCNASEYKKPQEGAAYALFAAIQSNHKVVRPIVEFTLTVKWPSVDVLRQRRKAQNRLQQQNLPSHIVDFKSEVENAFTAWLTLGGLGARTRRGCGAVYCEKIQTGFPPKLAANARFFIGEPQRDAESAWNKCVFDYREFRQNPRGRKHNKTISKGKIISVQGRSHWPEADSIRKITKCSLKPTSQHTSDNGDPADINTNNHSVPVVPSNLLPAFPKAVLGMPINFHFADGPGNRYGLADRDPKDVELRPIGQNTNRMASPVLTRPLFYEGKWCPAVIIIDPRLPNDFQAKLVGPKAKADGSDIDELVCASEIQGDAVRKLKTMRGKQNALEALAEYLLKEAKYKKVQL